MTICEEELKSEYLNLLASIRPLVFRLASSNDATNCLLWLTKFDELDVNEYALRNKLLLQLLQNVINKRLEYPFTEKPAEGSLKSILKKEKLDIPSFYSMDPNSSMYGNSVDSDLGKYRLRSKQHKQAILQYRNMIKNMLKSKNVSQGDDLLVVPPLNLSGIPDCQCNDEEPKNDNRAENLLIRLKNLEDKTDYLEIKFSNAESNLKSKSTLKNGSGDDKMEKRYKAELKRIITEKDEIINNLKEGLNKLSLDINNKSEEVYTQKLSELEVKYKNQIEEIKKQHQMERRKDREKIETLQDLLRDKPPS